jgi:hypothetical protein
LAGDPAALVPPYEVLFAGDFGYGLTLHPYTLSSFSGWAKTVVTQDNTADLGAATPRSGCEGTCGSPINLANGNVWIEKQDYSIPGIYLLSLASFVL